MDSVQRRWLIINSLIITAIVNAGSGAFWAWVSSVGEHKVPLVAIPLIHKPNTMTDTIGTLFILPFVTTWISTISIRREQQKGRLNTLGWDRRGLGLLARLPESPRRRALAVGGACLAVLGPVTAVLLVVFDFGGITRSHFILYKTILCVDLGLIVTPFVTLVAMADQVEVAVPVVEVQPSPQLATA